MFVKITTRSSLLALVVASGLLLRFRNSDVHDPELARYNSFDVDLYGFLSLYAAGTLLACWTILGTGKLNTRMLLSIGAILGLWLTYVAGFADWVAPDCVLKLDVWAVGVLVTWVLTVVSLFAISASIGGPSGEHRPTTRQFSIRHLILWTVIFGILLAGFKWAGNGRAGVSWQRLLTDPQEPLLFGAICSIFMLPWMWALCSRRKPLTRWAVAAIVANLLLQAAFLVARYQCLLIAARGNTSLGTAERRLINFELLAFGVGALVGPLTMAWFVLADYVGKRWSLGVSLGVRVTDLKQSNSF